MIKVIHVLQGSYALYVFTLNWAYTVLKKISVHSEDQNDISTEKKMMISVLPIVFTA